MQTDHRDMLANIQRFDQLIAYLRDEMGWPIESSDLEELTFDYTPDELGIDVKNAAKIESIKRLRPLSHHQPWGIFFVKFEPKKLPVVALRRILSRVTFKKRASANSAERTAWAANDLLFISNYGEGDERTITFAHFSHDDIKQDLPVLKVLGWNDEDTALHLDSVAGELTSKLAWPANEEDAETWREQWRSAFTVHHREVITTSKDLSIHLAKLARTIRNRINTALRIETERGPLKKLMKTFQDALIHDLDADGFADMYAQTIAYGLLSARITNPKSNTADVLHTLIPVTNPFLKELMETFLHVGGRNGKAGGPGIDFDELGISEVVELLDEAKMEAIIRDFGDRNPQEDPVIHFYELFLKEYDAKKRLQRGVFYTPRPVVSYIVRSVDELLRSEFNLQDGLADTTTWGEMVNRHKDLKIPEGTSPDQAFVQILDPATGTGTFLVETIDLIHHTMEAKWKKQGCNNKKNEELWNEYVTKHLLPRLHGYELLMAPYAIAHLKIGLKLYETGYHFNSEERVRVYLTNSLEPASDIGQLTLMGILKAIAHEAQAVNEIKRHQRFTVIIGNPPYSEKSKNEGVWIIDLMERYKKTIRSEEAQIKSVSNDYVKFLCLCHHLAEQTDMSIIGLITSNGYLDGRLFRDLRRAWLESFDNICVLNLHGSGRRGDAHPEDENVFEILQGVSIVIAQRFSPRGVGQLRYGEMIGHRAEKYSRLLIELPDRNCTTSVNPREPLYLFIPYSAAQFLTNAWSLSEIFGTGNPRKDRNKTYAGGFKTRQDSFTVAFEEDTLRQRIAELAKSSISETTLRENYRLCTTAHFEFTKARQAAQSGALTQAIRRIRYRPFDDRPMIWAREVLCEPQIEVTQHLLHPNLCLVTSRVVKDDAFRHVSVTRGPVEVISLSSSTSTNAYMFPLYRYISAPLLSKNKITVTSVPNLSRSFIIELAQSTGLHWDDQGSWGDERTSFGAEDVFHYIYAVLHSPTYRELFADDLLRDFPRIPLPVGGDTFRVLAQPGGELVALHLMESPKLEQHITTYTGPANPEVEKITYSEKTVWINKAQTIGFRGVPEAIWNFYIGGYQVCEKWLKDRKGRTLSKDDLTHYQKIVIALAETIRLMQEIDEIIEQNGGWTKAFHTSNEKTIAPPKRLLDF